MTDWRQEVGRALRDEAWLDRVLVIARDTMSTTPGWSPGQYDDETLRQTIRAFAGLVSEALDSPSGGEPGTSWQLFMEATIPAYVAAGQSAASLVGGSTSFLVLLTAELTSNVPPAARDDALQWLAAFAGRYVTDVCAAATGASR